MSDEKLPKEYDQSVVQRVIEGVKRSIGTASKKASQDLYDTSQELKNTISKLTKKVANLAGEGEGEQGKAATFVPMPEDLSVYEFGTWGFATVNPFLRWKFRGKIVGYEFYGSMNATFIDDDPSKPDFEVQETTYTQQGTHTGYSSLLEGMGTVASPNTYLNTKAIVDADSFILDRNLVKPIASNRLLLENVTTGESRYIGGEAALPNVAYHPLVPKYRIFAGTLLDPLEWRNGDIWRIKNYPSNRLFAIGALCIFYKRMGNFYVKARTIGKGHSYSGFTAAASSQGVTSAESISPPEIVMPIHGYDNNNVWCGGECTLAAADDYKPRCTRVAGHGIVPWSQIWDGTREVDHFSFFGFEACNVEFVWKELDPELGDFFYQTKRKVAEEDTEYIENKEGDVG